MTPATGPILTRRSCAPTSTPATRSSPPASIEHLTGVAQVPIGIAGPLRIRGEHAPGEVVVPLATTEGRLVASDSRGMRLLTECGGVTTTVVDDAMQRAPVVVLGDALPAREFGHWVSSHDRLGRNRP